MSNSIRVLVVGCGHMGTSHARAYQNLDGFEIAGLVSRSAGSREKLAAELDGDLPLFADFATALAESNCNAVSINSYPDTHAPYAIASFEAGKHVFLEKPIAETVEGAQAVVDAAKSANRKLVVGYILRHHPSWMRFIEVAQTLGKPLVMRMNLNQQSSGANWETHKCLMNSLSPIVDCGVHYVDVMCQMTGAKPVRVSAMGARLSDELNPGMYNYGQLQVTFDDGSCGWYEAGWGPMMSETAFFVKDVVGPKGCVSIVAREAGAAAQSANVDAHCKTESLLHHRSPLDDEGKFVHPDEWIDLSDEPGHDELCEREQAYFLRAIREDVALDDHMADAVNSLRIVLAADQSFREGREVQF
ncbi:MAG: putative dehydrogenase [Rhodothermales bacterium]|jgi:predicted dehydrogenase